MAENPKWYDLKSALEIELVFCLKLLLKVGDSSSLFGMAECGFGVFLLFFVIFCCYLLFFLFFSAKRAMVAVAIPVAESP